VPWRGRIAAAAAVCSDQQLASIDCRSQHTV